MQAGYKYQVCTLDMRKDKNGSIIYKVGRTDNLGQELAEIY